MGKGYVKGGTPIGSESLCRTCSYALIMTGYRESEMVSVCRSVHPNIVLPFRIYECTGYHDKNKPSYMEMQKLRSCVSGRAEAAGFKVGKGFGETTVKVAVTEDEESYDEDDE